MIYPAKFDHKDSDCYRFPRRLPDGGLPMREFSVRPAERDPERSWLFRAGLVLVFIGYAILCGSGT